MFVLVFLLALPTSVFATISFTISNPVREGDYYIVDTTLSGISTASAYVFGVFTNTASPNYFGSTWGQKESWVGYQSFSKDFIVSNFPILQKDNLQKIWIKPNYLDSGYKGPGEYFLKLRRYTGGSDNSAGDSNTLIVNLTESLPTPTVTPTHSPTPTKSPTPSKSSTPSVIPTSSVIPGLTRNPSPTAISTKTPTPSLVSTKTPIIVISTDLPAVAGAERSQTTKIPSVIARSLGDVAIQESDIPNSSPSSILGTSTSSSVIASLVIEPKQSQPSTHSAITSLSSLKNTFILGAIIAAVSGGILYFRLRNG